MRSLLTIPTLLEITMPEYVGTAVAILLTTFLYGLATVVVAGVLTIMKVLVDIF
jgi:hypothetical protein